MTAMNDKVAHVTYRRIAIARMVLMIDGRNGNDATQSEIEVELQRRVVRIRAQAVEHGRFGNGFTAAAMSDQYDTVEIYLAEERVVRIFIPIPPLSKMLQQHPTPGITFFLETTGGAAK